MNLDFIFQHMPFFKKQHAVGMRMAPVGDGKLSPIGFYFKIDAMWHTGVAPVAGSAIGRMKTKGDDNIGTR